MVKPSGRRGTRSGLTFALLRGLLLIVVLALIGGALGYLVGRQTANRFTAQATVLVTPLQGNPYSPDGTGDQLVNLETEAQVVRSDAVAREVSQKVDGTESTGILSNLSVTVPSNTQILTIAYTAGSKQSARRHAQAFADEYLAFRKTRAESSESSQVDRIQTQIDTQNQALDTLTRRIRRTSDPVRKAVLQAQLHGITSQIAQFRNALSLLQSGSDDPGQVITPAHVVSRRPLTVLALATGVGVLVGLLLGILLVVLRARSRTRLRDAEEVTVAGLPLLGRVRLRELRETNEAAAARGDREAPIGPGLRELRVALLSRQRRRPVRMLLAPVTDQATHPHSALGLAYSLARSELTTVLIDATAGAAGITGVLGLDDAPGFSDALTHSAELQEALHTVSPHLQVMPAGRRDAHAQDLLVSPSMVALLDHLEQGADVVIVAAGPIGGAPARALAMAVDNIVVEAVGGRTRTTELSSLAESEDADWQVSGVVYVDPRRRAR